jgi:hypothetical protein
MHDPERDLPVLIRAAEVWTDIDLPPVSVVSTGVLERARRLGMRQESGESAAEFYRRMAVIKGVLPGLLDCYHEYEWPDSLIRPTDRLFGPLATHLVYQHHFGGRLLQPMTQVGGAGPRE